MLTGLRERLAALASACPGLELRERPEHLQLEPRGGLAVTLTPAEDSLAIDFAGWTERFTIDPDEPDDDDLELALDFAAAACFGDLRVLEHRRGDQPVQLRLEVRVDGIWRRHASRGRRGLGLFRRVTTTLHQNALARPPALRDKLPTGLPSAPWAGAGGFAWAAPPESPAPLPLDGELDLHNVDPKEVGALVREYIEQCSARGIVDLRIVHGKGKGVLRRTVHHLLAKHPAVEHYRLGGHGEGSWGATIVRLRSTG